MLCPWDVAISLCLLWVIGLTTVAVIRQTVQKRIVLHPPPLVSTPPLRSGEHIPRIAYVYWEGPSDPLVERCIHSLTNLNPDWMVVRLSRGGIFRHGGGSMSAQHRSDVARVVTLAHTGGVWVDASCFHLKPLETWIDMSAHCLQGFSAPFDERVMENWCFATPADLPLMRAWRDEFLSAVRCGFRAYNRAHPAPSALRKWLPYLTQHQALHVARSLHPEHECRTRSSTAPGGPYYLIAQCKWDKECFRRAILEGRAPAFEQMPFVKITSGLRRMLKGAEGPILDGPLTRGATPPCA